MQFAPKNPVPVFPLPSLVLFPRAVLPLHVFELRYRTMVREALSGERMIAMALLKPGWQGEYHGNPEVFTLGCLARFEEVEWLPNDCYDLKLLGISRVRFGRVTREYPYRAARVELLPQEPYTEDDPLIQLEKRALLETFERWRTAAAPEAEHEPPSPGQPPRTRAAAPAGQASLADPVAYELLVNAMCMHVEAPALEKLRLLELDSIIERGRRIRELTERQARDAERPVRPGGEQN